MKSVAAAALLAASLAAPAFAQENAFHLTSTAFAEGGLLPPQQVLDGFGCSGGNRSPDLAWTAPPAGTRSLAVTVYDPDAPTGSGWWHWVVFGLPPSAQGLTEGAGDPSGVALPPGAVQARTDFGGPGYGGACPPEGDPAHRYVFTVWALGADSLPLDADASGAMVGFFLNRLAVGKATLTARYGR